MFTPNTSAPALAFILALLVLSTLDGPQRPTTAPLSPSCTVSLPRARPKRTWSLMTQALNRDTPQTKHPKRSVKSRLLLQSRRNVATELVSLHASHGCRCLPPSDHPQQLPARTPLLLPKCLPPPPGLLLCSRSLAARRLLPVVADVNPAALTALTDPAPRLARALAMIRSFPRAEDVLLTCGKALNRCFLLRLSHAAGRQGATALRRRR